MDDEADDGSRAPIVFVLTLTTALPNERSHYSRKLRWRFGISLCRERERERDVTGRQTSIAITDCPENLWPSVWP